MIQGDSGEGQQELGNGKRNYQAAVETQMENVDPLAPILSIGTNTPKLAYVLVTVESQPAVSSDSRTPTPAYICRDRPILPTMLAAAQLP